MMTSSINPFQTDSFTEPDKFFGRKELLAETYRFLQHSRNKILFVNGPRRIGKTSLLRKLQHETTKRGFVPVYVDLHGKAEEPLPQILYDVMAAINTEIKNTSPFSISDFENDYCLFDQKYLPSIAQTLGKIVLLFDEFDVPGDRIVLREEAATRESAYVQFVPYVHALLEKPIALKCIFAVGRSLSDLSEYYEPVKTMAACETLDEFGLSDTTDLIASLATGGIRFTSAAVEAIQRHTKGFPHFVQCMASFAFDYANKQKLNEIEASDIESQIVIAVEKYSGVISLAVAGVTPQERAYLILIAKLRERGHMATEKAILHEMKQLGIDTISPDVARAVSGLLEAKIIVYNQNFLAYSFSMPFLEKWFVREYIMKDVVTEINKTDRQFDGYMRLAKAFHGRKEFTKAVSLFRAITEEYPQNFEAHYGLALALDCEGKASLGDVIAEFEKAYRLNPDRSRRTYKSLLKKAYEKENASPFLEKLVELGDSTIEDRKTLLKSYCEIWKSEILAGEYGNFQSAIKNKLWLLKEYLSEIIQFIDGLITEMVKANPQKAEDFVSSLKGGINDLQLRIWLLRIANSPKKVMEGAPTERIKPPVKPLLPKPLFLGKIIEKKLFIKAIPMAVVPAILLLVIAIVYFHRPAPKKRLAEAPSIYRSVEKVIKRDIMQIEKIQDAPEPIKKDPPSQAAPQAVPQATPQAVQKVIQSDSLNDSIIKNEARIMLVNASSMYLKGLAAKSRAKLIKRGFPSPNVLTGNNSNKVSMVYAYYSSKRYVPLIKEILYILYPDKEDSFFDISSKDRTVNGWIRKSFQKEQLHILIRMPNVE